MQPFYLFSHFLHLSKRFFRFSLTIFTYAVTRQHLRTCHPEDVVPPNIKRAVASIYIELFAWNITSYIYRNKDSACIGRKTIALLAERQATAYNANNPPSLLRLEGLFALCCPRRIRTTTDRTKNCSATITP